MSRLRQSVVQLVHGLGILVGIRIVVEVLAVDVVVCALVGGGWGF